MKIGYDGKRAVQNLTGLGNYSRYVIESLQTYSPQNKYLLYTPKERSNPRLKQILNEADGSTDVLYPSSFMWKRLSSIWRIKGIRKDLERDNIDLFHGLSNELPLNIRKLNQVKSVVTIHDLIFLRYPYCYHWIDRKIYNYKFKHACENADIIIAVSECTKRDIIHFYGIPAEKIKVIYQGCDPSFSRHESEKKKEEVRSKYNLPERYILSVGSIERRKNALVIAKALAFLPEDIHLVLVGKRTPYVDEIMKYVNAHHLGSRVHLLHHTSFSDLPAIYQCTETFIYPSLYEGFGIPIVEALNSGVPVVAATGSCLEEAGGRYSLYVSPYDVTAMAKAIEECFDTEKRVKMITEGRKWAQKFSQEQMAEQTLDCYKKLLYN